MLPFTSATEPLRLANQISGRELYKWNTVSIADKPVATSGGITITPSATLSTLGRCDGLIVCGGADIYSCDPQPYLDHIKRFANMNVDIGAICTGSYLLAQCGLLDGYRSTIQWESLASFREEFPSTMAPDRLFEIDRDRFTAAGGTAPMDMMLQIISARHGRDLAMKIADTLTLDRIRSGDENQRMSIEQRLGSRHAKLIEAVSIMEANLEEPISVDELCQLISVSRRHLERLFKAQLKSVPNRYYLALRMQRAHQLITQTDMSLVDVACACGFVSSPHFTKCYRDYYGIPPSREPRMRVESRTVVKTLRYVVNG